MPATATERVLRYLVTEVWFEPQKWILSKPATVYALAVPEGENVAVPLSIPFEKVQVEEKDTEGVELVMTWKDETYHDPGNQDEYFGSRQARTTETSELLGALFKASKGTKILVAKS